NTYYLFLPFPPEQYLQKALESLTQAYKGLEKEEKKEQVKQLEDYTRSILAGENPFIKGKKRKKILRKNLPSSSLPTPPYLPPPSSRSPPTSTRSKKKQLQERKLVLITD
ncbi:uncharacterized protein K441DRAFT_672129, partial [Cenococcum geophilum 1.58]